MKRHTRSPRAALTLCLVLLCAGLALCAVGCSAGQLAKAQQVSTQAQAVLDTTAPAVEQLRAQVRDLDAKAAAATAQAAAAQAQVDALRSSPAPNDPVAVQAAQKALDAALAAQAQAQKGDAAAQQALAVVASFQDNASKTLAAANALIAEFKTAKTQTDQAAAVISTVGAAGAAIPGVGTWVTLAAGVAGVVLAGYSRVGKGASDSTLQAFAHAAAVTAPQFLPDIIAALPANVAATVNGILTGIGHVIPSPAPAPAAAAAAA